MMDTFEFGKSTKRFTVAEANAMLPLLRSIVADISEIFRDVTGRRVDLHRLLRKRDKSSGYPYHEERAETRADLQEEYDRIWKYREELEALGVMLRQPERGWVEFPTRIHGKDAFLSWRLGEHEISYWRETDAPFTARRSIPTLETAGNQ